jgi:soluble lytic murein transglycosylase-like protein
MRRAAAILVLGTLALSPRPAGAGEVCSYKDAEGNWVFSNVALGANCKKRVKIKDTPAPAYRAPAPSRDAAERDAKNELKATVLMPPAYREHIRRAADYYKLPEELLHAVMAVESSFNPVAVSSKGAAGLMQLMPGTAKDMYVSDVWTPEQNIEGGARYLRVLANQYEGDLVKTLAAYNAGPEAVRRAGGLPNIPETREYVRKVLALYARLRRRNVKG